MGPSVPIVDALIVVDMQRAFVEGDGAAPDVERLLAVVRGQIDSAHEAGAVVVQLQNDGGPGSADEPGAWGWELAIEPAAQDLVVRKGEDDGFVGTDLDQLLRKHQVAAVSVCGVMSEMCVAATARGAMSRGYRVVLAHDAHGTYPVPPCLPGEREVPAALAARAAEWSLGDTVIIAASSGDVRFASSGQGQQSG